MTTPTRENEMEDKELLELAAKAVGIKLTWRAASCAFYYNDIDVGREEWNPLQDDGQALRLAVKLDMDVCRGLRGPQIGVAVLAMRGPLTVAEYLGTDPVAATRRAIVRAAAEIGKSLPTPHHPQPRSPL